LNFACPTFLADLAFCKELFWLIETILIDLLPFFSLDSSSFERLLSGELLRTEGESAKMFRFLVCPKVKFSLGCSMRY